MHFVPQADGPCGYHAERGRLRGLVRRRDRVRTVRQPVRHAAE